MGRSLRAVCGVSPVPARLGFDREFGCGTEINLLILAKIAPEARLAGCDWASASQVILRRMAEQTGCAIEGHRFNMLTASGDGDGSIGAPTAILTVHALEQLGAAWVPFLDHVRSRGAACACMSSRCWNCTIPPHRWMSLPAAIMESETIFEASCRPYKILPRGEAEIVDLRRIPFGGLITRRIRFWLGVHDKVARVAECRYSKVNQGLNSVCYSCVPASRPYGGAGEGTSACQPIVESTKSVGEPWPAGAPVRVGLVQINNGFSGQNYLPYSVACLQSYVSAQAVQPDRYRFERLIYKRMPIGEAVYAACRRARRGFSAYVWNEQISLACARRLKERNPAPA